MNPKKISFSSDSQLLAELGERLISTPQVALGELVKNAYDADAQRVNIWLGDDGTLNVKDDGHGMSEAEFTNGWMRIASSHKLLEEKSRRYGRPLTGSKGVGRFAVRLLGDELLLETSSNRESGLRAKFPWRTFQAGGGIDSHPITYWTDVEDVERGTWLRISELRQEWDVATLAQVSRDVLGLQTPYFVQLDKAASKPRGTKADPGFKVFFAPPGSEQSVDDSTREIFERAAIRLRLKVRDQEVRFKYSFRSGREPVRYRYTLKAPNLVGLLDADIRFLPKRPGAFAALDHHDGRSAAAWVRENGGVRVFDRGFRVPPYGSSDDDWLRLSEHGAANKRDWDSEITKELLPAPEKAPVERLHPALHLPANHQVLGYVSVQSHNLRDFPEKVQHLLLQPSMDRQGFVGNDGFRQLYSIVRAGLELLAYIDLDEELRRKAELSKEAGTRVRESINDAIEGVSGNADIPPVVRKTIVASLRRVAARARESEALHEEAEVAVETLGLLGVVAAFMTHEMITMLRETTGMLRALDDLRPDAGSKSDRQAFEKAKEATRAAHGAIERHVDYVRKFASNTRAPPSGRFKAKMAIKGVVRQFEYFTTPRNIDVEVLVDSALEAPAMPMSVYSGVALNLYTNALKAVLSKRDGTTRQVRVTAELDDGTHVLQVADSGIGVPSSLSDKIFEPLFSTTADDGPLGPGMGLGLYIVKRVLKSFDGRIRLVEPPDGYATALEVRIPDG